MKKYFLSFNEEAVLNPNYQGYVGGRIEVYDPDEEHAIEEIRFFTKDQSWYDFRKEWDGKNISVKELIGFCEIIKKKYYDKI